MPKNPVTDIWQFLTATTSDYINLGNWRYLILLLFWTLLIASLVMAYRNLKEDPSQRSCQHISMWIVRVLIGCMWFEGMLWKLPLPVSDGLQYWTEQEATRAAFELHRSLVKEFLLPHLSLFGPFVFLAELTFAASMILGLAVRAISVLAIFFVLQLWLGIYLPADPAEWSWSYVFLAMLMFLFSLNAAGRSLGADAWLRRHLAAVRDATGVLGPGSSYCRIGTERGPLLPPLAPQRQREADEGRCDCSRRLDASGEIARDFRHPGDPPALAHRNFLRRHAGGRDPHQHFQIPAIGQIAHAEAVEGVAPDGAKRRHVGETNAVDQPNEQAADMAGHKLLQRQAAGLALTAHARTLYEGDVTAGDRLDQGRDKGRTVAAVAIEKQQYVGIGAGSGNSGLNGPSITALRHDHHVSAGRAGAFGGAVARAPVNNNQLVDALGQHRGHDRSNRVFFVETRDHRRHDGRKAAGSGGSLRLCWHGRVLDYRLQRSPQLAQLEGGWSDRSAARKSR